MKRSTSGKRPKLTAAEQGQRKKSGSEESHHRQRAAEQVATPAAKRGANTWFKKLAI